MNRTDNLTILLFGSIRESLGCAQIEIPGMNGKTVIELKEYLADRFHNSSDIMRCMIAVNQCYASDETKLNSFHEIALIPPVNGG